MIDLVAFLDARLDDDEHGAEFAGRSNPRQGADSMRWTAEVHEIGTDRADGPLPTGIWVWDERDIGVGAMNGEAKALHIARYDPARALREVEAKRRIMARHSTRHTVVDGWCVEEGGQCTHAGEAHCHMCGYPAGCPTLLNLASIYADHPDYDPAWKIDAPH